MANINFVPDDYVQKRESLRANTFYLVLFVVAMGTLVGSFAFIKARQQAALNEQQAVARKMDEAKQSIAQLEELQARKKQMMQSVLLTAELIEPVPRSILLAALTNTLPAGASLKTVNIEQVMPRGASTSASQTRYQAAAKQAAGDADQQVSPEKLLETNIAIEGIATSDIEVAQYISRLTHSILFNKVSLVQSREISIKDDIMREFKLTAELKKDLALSEEDVMDLKALHENYQLPLELKNL